MPPFYRTNTHELTANLDCHPFRRNDSYILNALNLLIHFEYIKEQSEDNPTTNSYEKVKATIDLAESYNNLTVSLGYGIESNKDLLPSAKDELINSILVGLSWNKTINGLAISVSHIYTLSFDDSFMKSPDSVVSDITHTLNTNLSFEFAPSGSIVRLAYNAILKNSGSSDDTRQYSLKVGLEQLLFKTRSVESSLCLSYENSDYWSTEEDKRYVYDIYMLELSVKF
jgi:hypothetical protein